MVVQATKLSVMLGSNNSMIGLNSSQLILENVKQRFMEFVGVFFNPVTHGVRIYRTPGTI